MAKGKKEVVIEDPRAIRALAHPARLEAIDRLYSGEVATATELAEASGLSPSAMSYHLRELAKWGVIEREPASGDGRERRWRAAGDGLQIGTDRHHSTSETAAQMAITGQILDRMRNNIESFARVADREPAPWRDAPTVSASNLLLTAAELRTLKGELRKLLDRYDTKRKDVPEGARRVRSLFALTPVVQDRPRKM
jgi:DNA-binding transcriptional ArsR family regulator